MSKHQIIYTSCKRGINGVNDGQQIYSYDASFSENSSDSIKSLFTYQTPSLSPGVVMTEAIAETMPQSFMYRRLPDGSCAVVLNTYLGRDYMVGGRFGNHLSHAIVCDESEVNVYPCEFYGSEMLRSRMEPDEVRASERPPFLPEPDLVKGYSVSTESVSDFLCSNNRMESYKKMLAAMLSYEKARKRVVICDSTENIVMWIASLQYALPLELALNVNFTTYEFDPSLSASQICGVISEGTRYNINNADAHYTFDFINNIFPNIKEEGDFYDFIDMGMSMSYDSIQAFHEFICEKLSYRNPDEQYYHIYELYCLFTDGLDNISLNTFKNAVQMSDAFALENVKDELVSKLVEERVFILSTTDEYAMEILKVILNRMSSMSNAVQENIRALVTEKAITSFVSASAKEDSFSRLYSEIEMLGRTNNIIIPYELMKESNREKLLSAIGHSAEQWRWNFIVDVLCDYVKVQNIPAEHLNVKYEMGQLIGNIIKARVTADTNNGFTLIAKTIDKFADNCFYLINMTFNFEKVLSGLPDSKRIINELWKYVCHTIAKKQAANKRNIYAFLLSNNRLDKVFDIFKELMDIADSIKSAKELFQEQLELNNESYTKLYILRIYECYYDYLTTHKEADTSKALRGLLKSIISRNLDPNFADELIAAVLAAVPLENPSRENGELVVTLLDYYKNQCIEGRLLLIATGMVFNKVKSKTDLVSAVKDIRSITGGEAINLVGLQVADSEKYIGWIVPNIYDSCETANDLIQSYNLFNHTKSSSRNFVGICAKEAFTEGKGDKEFSSILVFLEFLFNVGNANERKDAGEILCKLSKQKLENLDESVKEIFKGEKSYIAQWQEIREIAAATNPILKNIGNLFRRKKDAGDE